MLIRKSDKLFDFIQSMTSHERGYFKQNSNKNSYYVILFDAMCKQHSYHEAELIATLKKHGCARKISAIKEYLWKELTQAMAPYHLVKTPVGEALAQLQRVYLLSNKGLNPHINKELELLKRLCVKYELFDTQVQVMHFQYSYGYREFDLNEHFWAEFHNAVYSNMIHMNLSKIQHRLHFLKLKNYGKPATLPTLQESEELVSHPAMKDVMLHNSVRLQIIRESILDLHAAMTNNYEAMLNHNINIVALLEDKPHLIKDGREISTIYTNIITALANAGQRRQLAGVIDEIVERFKQIKDHHTDTLGHLLEIKVIRALVKNNFTKLGELQNDFLDKSHKFPVSIKHKLYYYFIAALIEKGSYEEAQDWIANALSFYRKHKHISTYYLDKLKVIHLLMHYQMGNQQYVGNQVESFVRTYKPVSKDKDINLFVVKYLGQALKVPEPRTVLVRMERNLPDAYDKNNRDLFVDVVLWLKCLLSNKDYAQESQRKIKQELRNA